MECVTVGERLAPPSDVDRSDVVVVLPTPGADLAAADTTNAQCGSHRANCLFHVDLLVSDVWILIASRRYGRSRMPHAPPSSTNRSDVVVMNPAPAAAAADAANAQRCFHRANCLFHVDLLVWNVWIPIALRRSGRLGMPFVPHALRTAIGADRSDVVINLPTPHATTDATNAERSFHRANCLFHVDTPCFGCMDGYRVTPGQIARNTLLHAKVHGCGVAVRPPRI